MADWVLASDRLDSILPMTDRSHGIHVSQVIHKLAVAQGLYKERDETTDTDRLRMELGNIMEAAQIARLCEDEPDRYTVPGEITVDDIHQTPDLVDLGGWDKEIEQTLDPAVVEMKFTYKSCRHHPTDAKLWTYATQLKCYCRSFGLSHGELRVCYVNGDWRHDSPLGFVPVYHRWRARFSDEELERNWRMIVSNTEGVEPE